MRKQDFFPLTIAILIGAWAVCGFSQDSAEEREWRALDDFLKRTPQLRENPELFAEFWEQEMAPSEEDAVDESDQPTRSPASRPQASATRRKVGVTRTTLVMQLPRAYRKFDRDQDHQIGLYEWPRADYARFATLDANQDGFLTPRELASPDVRGGSSSKRSSRRPAGL